MGCFYYLREKAKIKRKPKSEPISTISTSPSNNETSRSDGSASTKQTNMSSGSSEYHRSLSSLYEERGQNLRVFELNELRNATNEFSRLLKIGEGGFGCVYKASIKPPNGKGSKIAAAVKKLSQNGLQGHKQWLAEVQFLGVVQHPNLVKLIGYCAVDGERGVQRLLVYEFIPNKSLEDHLFDKAIPPLPWNIRLQIALGAAEGLVYLHEELEVQVIYRDFKASNVLLDEKFKPKLSDFGLAREGPSAGNTHVSTAVMGTHGYAAPDYIETGHLTSKSDVWSFGVVLYEILTGRHSVERSRPRMEQKLLDWIKQFPVDSNNFGAIVDPRLENKYSMKGAREVAELANGCLSKHARNRPMMSEVVGRLKHAMQFTEFDGEVGIVEEESVADLGIEKSVEKDEENTVSESLRRRMLHLSKLRESVNTVGRRRLTLMKAANQT